MPAAPHDALFKTVFSQIEHAEGELRLVLPPALVAHIDFKTLSLRAGSFVDEALRERATDLLFSVDIAGQQALLYVLFEHQSSSEALLCFRLLRYMVRIWESHLKDHSEARGLPLIIPIVLSQTDGAFRAETSFDGLYEVPPDVLDAAGEHLVRFRFVLDDLAAATDEELHERAMSALGRLCLWCLRNARSPDQLVQGIGDWLDLVRQVRRAPNGRAALAALWRYIFTVNRKARGQEVLDWLLSAVREDEAKEEIMSAADDFIELGHQRGLERGLAEGQRRTLLRQLRARFGELPAAVVARVQSAVSDELDLWAERVLSARTPDEVVAPM